MKQTNKIINKINDNVDIHSDVNTISTFTLFKDGKYMAGDNYSHYYGHPEKGAELIEENVIPALYRS